MRDAFLLGAGFSRAVFPDMPTMDVLFEELKPLVGTENGVSPEAYQYACKFGKVETLLSYYAVPNPCDDDIEKLRKRIVTARLEQRIGLVLQCQEARMDRLTPSLGKELVNKWMERQSHVLTANYDTLVEQLSGMLDDTQVSVLYPIPVVPSQAIMGDNPGRTAERSECSKILTLYKMHGSVSWYTSQDGSDSDPIYGYVGYGSGTITSSEKLLGGKRRFITPPVHDKSTLLSHERMRNLWSQAKNNALAPADRLYVIGYSLPETDMAMRTLLWESRMPRPQGEQLQKIPLYLVNTDRCLSEHYGKMLGDYYEVRDTYLGDDAFYRFVNDYVRD